MEVKDMSLFIPDRMTESAATYLRVHFEIVRYLQFTTTLAEAFDKLTIVSFPLLSEKLQAIAKRQEVEDPHLAPETAKRWEEFKPEPFNIRKEMKDYDHLLSSTMLAKAVDNFLCYLADVLSEVFRVKPEVLKSNDTKRVDWILGFSDFNDLLSAIAEDKVLTLSHSNIKDLDKYMREKMGMPLTIEPEVLERIATFNEYRNLIVHNRGIVNSLSKKKSSLIDEPVGTKLTFSWSEVWFAMEYMCACMAGLDHRIVEKFNVPTPYIGDELVNLLGKGSYKKIKLSDIEEGTES